MKLDAKFILFGAAIVLLALLYNKLNPNEEDVIRDRLHELADKMQMEEPEKRLQAFQRATFIKDYFSELVDVDVQMKNLRRPRFTDRNDLVSQYGIFRAILNRFEMEFQDIEIRLDGEDLAYVNCKVMLDFHINQISGDQGDYVPLEIEMRKEEGEWVIRYLKTLKDYKESFLINQPFGRSAS